MKAAQVAAAAEERALYLSEEMEIERAKEFVKNKGLVWGGAKSVFRTKGLYTYSTGKYKGKAYWGLGGVLWTHSASVKKPKERIRGWTYNY